MRALAVVFMLLCSIVWGTSVQAQESWLVLPVSSDEDVSWMGPTAAELRREMRERRLQVWSMEGATRKFEERHSSPRSLVSSSDIQEWIERSRDALRYLAAGDYGRARSELSALQGLSKRVAEELNRERERAQEVLDSCLDMVRLMLETRTRGEAKEQARACRQLVPRVDPSANRHPPPVLQVLDEVDKETADTGMLSIASVPSGCAFRINGLSFGTTPDSMRLFFGEYRVQAECNGQGRGRVHPVKLNGPEAKVTIDWRFDTVVRTQPFLQLRYSDDASKDKWLVRDAATVQQVMRVSHVLMVSSPQEGMLRVERLRKSSSDPKGLAMVNTTAEGPSRDDIDLAVKTVLKGECKDFTGARATTIPGCAGAKSGGWPADRTPKAHFWSGVGLVGLGGAMLFTGYGLHIARGSTGDDWAGNPTNIQLQQNWLNLSAPTIATGVIGGAALTAAMPLILPYRNKTPWWAWLSGGLGVAALAGSIARGVTTPTTLFANCDAEIVPGGQFTVQQKAQRCVDNGQARDLSILLGMTSAPLLTMPLVYLFRRKQAKVTPNIEIGRNAGRFTLSGRF